MKNLVKKSITTSLRSIHRQQGGQILILSLILLLLSSIMVIPLAHFMNTGLKTTQVYQRNAREIYAADSGIQYAMWKIKTDPSIISDRENNIYDQTYSCTAPMVNNNNVSVSINFTWLLSNIINLTNGAYPHDTWLGMDVSGNANPTVYNTPSPSHSIYSMTFAYSGSGNKKIEQMGVWLPHGFNYIPGSCSYANFPNNITSDNPAITSVCGGTSLVWSAHNYSFQNVNPPVAKQQFWYTPAGKTPKGAASWNKSQSNDIGYSWDNAIWWYAVNSTAVDTTISPNKATTVNALVISDPKTSSGINLVTYIIGP